MKSPKGYIIYAKRPGLPYAVFKKFVPEQDTPAFVRVFSDGSWTGHESKRINAPIIDHGHTIEDLG